MTNFICAGKQFTSLEKAKRHAQRVFEKTGAIVVSIEAAPVKLKLSATQRRLLDAAAMPNGTETPFTGNRHAGTTASAWYRTMESLQKRGLVTLTRAGDHYRARATDAGRGVLEAK
jgi:hypothetical protein